MVIQTLNDCNIPFMIVGSLSSNAYGIERSTKDLELLEKTLQSIPQ